MVDVCAQKAKEIELETLILEEHVTLCAPANIQIAVHENSWHKMGIRQIEGPYFLDYVNLALECGAGLQF